MRDDNFLDKILNFLVNGKAVLSVMIVLFVITIMTTISAAPKLFSIAAGNKLAKISQSASGSGAVHAAVVGPGGTATVKPGEIATYILTITNPSGGSNRVYFEVPAGFDSPVLDIAASASGVTMSGTPSSLIFDNVPAGSEVKIVFRVTAH